MKIYLIAALFLGALVVAHSLEEDEKVELPEVPEQPEQSDEEVSDPAEEDTEDVSDPEGGGGTEGDTEESEDEEVADEEEDPEKRRRRNVLSLRSCVLLKRRGYCRRQLFIRRLCAATCYVKPPVCRDRLSRISCLRLKGFKKCKSAVGRLYCRKTCRHCGVSPADPCRRYAVLNQLNRRQSRNRGNALLCDQKGFATRWYRFTGLAGNRMPTRAPPKNRCGTHAPGWMVGSYPRRKGQVVRRKVCYHWGKKICNWSNFIKVKNCGRYFVFYLSRTPICHLRYCGNA